MFLGRGCGSPTAPHFPPVAWNQPREAGTPHPGSGGARGLFLTSSLQKRSSSLVVGGPEDFLIPAKLALGPLELGSFTGRAKTGEQKTERALGSESWVCWHLLIFMRLMDNLFQLMVSRGQNTNCFPIHTVCNLILAIQLTYLPYPLVLLR